jgi:hypothetical protein
MTMVEVHSIIVGRVKAAAEKPTIMVGRQR